MWYLAIPDFFGCGASKAASNWNDLACLVGKEETKRQMLRFIEMMSFSNLTLPSKKSREFRGVLVIMFSLFLASSDQSRLLELHILLSEL
jgi:hypothetical protein